MKKDFIYVFIEIFGESEGEHRISMNELVIDKLETMPFQFDYRFIESREYIKRKAQDRDEIDQY